MRDQARKADGGFMRAHARQGASSAACIIFDFNVPFGSFPMPGLAKRCKDDPTFGRRLPTLAQWVGAGQAGLGCLGFINIAL